ncbi:hypothetical protein SELMODRAFT_95435, partial [Selaginella moellendorffii]
CLECSTHQKESSVIYVSFASVATMSAEQFQELARGLERSNQPFVWCCARPSSRIHRCTISSRD